MELKELRNTPHLSASSIGDYLDCSLLYKFGRIDKIQAEFKSDALEFGSAIHLTLADFHLEKMKGNLPTIKDLHNVFAIHWKKLTDGRDDIKYAEGNNPDVLLLQGQELLTAYYNKSSWREFECIGIEEPFSFMIKGCPLPIIGSIDLIEKDRSGTIIINDFKTSARAYSNDEVDKNFQLTLYQMAVRANGYEASDILLRFDCLIKTKQPKFDNYYTTRSDIDEIRARKKIVEVAKGISKGIFIPNDSTQNWKCKGCAFKKNCDAWFMEEAA
jgi:putative RecB family exonuclease